MIDLIKKFAKQKDAYVKRIHDTRGYGDMYCYSDEPQKCTESAISYDMNEGKQTIYYVTGVAYGIERFTKWCCMDEIKEYSRFGYCKPADVELTVKQ